MKRQPVPEKDDGAEEEEGGRKRLFDSDAATATNARAAKKSRSDVYAALMDMEEKKMETDAEEKRAECEFRTKQTEILAKLADAMDPTKTLEVQREMIRESHLHQEKMQRIMMEFIKEFDSKKK